MRKLLGIIVAVIGVLMATVSVEEDGTISVLGWKWK